MKVPLLDLKSQYSEIKDELRSLIDEILNTQRCVLGENVRELEESIASYCGTGHAVGLASGSDAILISMMALNIGHGDKVLTTPFTFFATAGCIHRLGATPVFIDIEEDSYNIDPVKIREFLENNRSDKSIKAILPVHLYGQCANMSEIMSIAKEFELYIIEDAAQSIGATYKGKQSGSIGDFGCFSFYPTKNLGAAGDGGMLITNNSEYADKARLLRDHGARQRYYYDFVGLNSRLDEIQAAVLRVKLKKLNNWLGQRVANAELYNELLGGHDKIKTPITTEGCTHTYHQYVIRTENRDSLKKYLDENGIGNAIFYPLSLHTQKCFEELGYKEGDFPISEKAASEVLALPVFAGLTEEQIEFVSKKIITFFDNN